MAKLLNTKLHISKKSALQGMLGLSALAIFFTILLLNIPETITLNIAFFGNIVFSGALIRSYKMFVIALILMLLIMVRSRIYDYFRITPLIELSADGIKVRKSLSHDTFSRNDLVSFKIVEHNTKPYIDLVYNTKNSFMKRKSFKCQISFLDINRMELEKLIQSYSNAISE